MLGVQAVLLCPIVLVAGVQIESPGRGPEAQVLSLSMQLISAHRVVAVVAALLFLSWMYRARARQRWFLERAGAPQSPRSNVSPWRSVEVWFVPVANLFLPYQEVKDMFRLEPTGPGDRDLDLPVWWGCLVAAGVLTVVVHVGARMSAASFIVWRYVLLMWLNVLRYGLLLISAVLAIRWIGEFERRAARHSTAGGERLQ